MRTRIGNYLWGVFFIVIGLGFAGNILFDWNFNLFFRGVWTLIIIIPAALSIIQNGFSTGSVTCLSIGVLFLLSSQNIIDSQVVAKLIVPIILIVIGVRIIFSDFTHKHKHIDYSKASPDSLNYSAIFGSQNVNYEGQTFLGAELNAIFGGVVLRLDNAIITEDTVINCSAIFGGIDIFIPNDVNVKVSSTPIFGGVDNKHKKPYIQDAPTIYINATCMFGGVDIR